MSRNYKQLADSSNPFYCDDDDDNEEEYSGSKIQQIKARISRSENEQIDRLSQIKRVIAESEDIGNNTLEELHHQGEQLDNAEAKLDSIEAMTKVTQTHINSIQSVFGALKKKLFGRKTESTVMSDIQHNRLRDSADSPASGAGSTSHHSSNEDKKYGGLRDEMRVSSSSTTRQDVIEEQLGDLSVGLERLKEMGLSMNDELNRQDATIDRLTTKTERNHLVLQDQNSQMRKLLK